LLVHENRRNVCSPLSLSLTLARKRVPYTRHFRIFFSRKREH
jgi:hypothetical protein